MNEETKLILSKVEYEIRDASTHFELVIDLFGSKDKLDIVNASAPTVFIIIRQSLLDSAIIKLNRLCDPPGAKKDRNICLASLREALDQSDANFIKKLEILEGEIKSEVQRLRKYRNKILAHNDLKSYKKKDHRVIPNKAINSALELLESYLNKIYLKFENYTVSILDIPYSLGDGPERLMKLLKKGIDCQQGAADNSGKRRPLSLRSHENPTPQKFKQ